MDNPTDLRQVPPSLTAAVRRARLEDAERSEVVAELRGAELARLEMLQDALKPVFDQLTDAADLFDTGLMPGNHPRLFIDMIGFVEMGRDRRAYRFVQDSRHGRVTLAESERIDTIVSAVADYVARRLIEREKALAADRTIEEAARAYARTPPQTPPPRAKSALARPVTLLATVRMLVEILGSVVLIALVAFGAYFVLVALLALWATRALG